MTTQVATPRTSIARNRLIAIGGGLVAALLTWGIAVAVGVELVVTRAGTAIAIGAVNVILSTLLASFAGWGVLALLERFTARARTIWTVVAVAVVVLSLLPTVTADASTGTRIALTAMHLAVGAVVVPLLRKDARNA